MGCGLLSINSFVLLASAGRDAVPGSWRAAAAMVRPQWIRAASDLTAAPAPLCSFDCPLDCPICRDILCPWNSRDLARTWPRGNGASPHAAGSQCFGNAFSRMRPTDSQWAGILLTRGVQRSNTVGYTAGNSPLFRIKLPTSVLKTLRSITGKKSN